MKSIVFFLILIILVSSKFTFAQNDEFKTTAKPQTDSSAKKKGGILGGLIQSDLLDNVKNAKKSIKENQDEFKRFSSETSDLAADLGLKINKSKKKSKGKKKPKDEYENIKFELRIGEYGSGTRLTFEEIHVLRNPDEAEPSIYAKEIWWYDPKLRRITNVPRKDKNYGEICHGPYKKYVNDELIEEGFFYVGVKDGRWATYNQQYILLTKETLKKGFLADSKITYYDKDETKIKEVVPVKFKKVSGDYRSFYEGGQLKEEGKFDDSVKIGRWREYHQFGAMGRLKKETLYAKDKFDTSNTVVLQERDAQGKLIYEAPKQIKKKNEEVDEN
jgi:hypothetical protein